ncbi:TetR/AcrR family transcriptional regulator [Kibdelosporangium lantanae]
MRAALAELAEVGYAGVSMERIATRARTSKAALYRRWPDRAHLIVDSYIRFVVQDVQIPDTGSLRGDVINLLRQLVDLVGSPMVVMLHGLMSDAANNCELRGIIREHVAAVKPRLMADIMDRARVRGEIRDNVTPRQMTVPLELMRGEILMHDGQVTDQAIEQIVDEVFLPLVQR